LFKSCSATTTAANAGVPVLGDAGGVEEGGEAVWMEGGRAGRLGGEADGSMAEESGRNLLTNS
jgi:hypothetical protein